MISHFQRKQFSTSASSRCFADPRNPRASWSSWPCASSVTSWCDACGSTLCLRAGDLWEIFWKSLGNLWEIFGKIIGKIGKLIFVTGKVWENNLKKNWEKEKHLHEKLEAFWGQCTWASRVCTGKGDCVVSAWVCAKNNEMVRAFFFTLFVVTRQRILALSKNQFCFQHESYLE